MHLILSFHWLAFPCQCASSCLGFISNYRYLLVTVVNYADVGMMKHWWLNYRNGPVKYYSGLTVVLNFLQVYQWITFNFVFSADERWVGYYFLDIFLNLFCHCAYHCILLFPPFSCYRDGNLPVSFIQKYLAKKLDLTSEVEVRSQFHFLKIDSPLIFKSAI